MQPATVTTPASFFPENYGDYFPGKELGYNLPSAEGTELVLSNDELMKKILRECFII